MKKAGAPKAAQVNHPFRNPRSKEQKPCRRAASLLRVRLFRFSTARYFSELPDFVPKAKTERR